MAKQTIAEFLATPNVGGYDVDGHFDSGIWYDWFCKDHSLIRRGNALLSKLKAIASSTKFDNDKCYVFFKNNCPMSGPLYDSFSICDIATGDVLFWVTAKSGHSGCAEVVSKDSNYEIIVKGSWKEVKNYFLK
jgi:hypothetical protein